MLITRTSLLTGVTRTMDLDVTPEQIIAWQGGTVAQVAFAHLSKDQREYIISGITQEEWDTMTPDDAL